MPDPSYTIRKADHPPDLSSESTCAPWRVADTAALSFCRPEGSDHHPDITVRLLYDRTALYGQFRVRDRYVRCVHTAYQDMVCEDSCVEFFVQPRGEGPYCNFEFSCGGTLLASCITDPARVPNGFADFVRLDRTAADAIRIFHSMPPVVDPEISDPVEWTIAFAIPFGVLERHMGPLGDPAGQTWRGNFYKCGDKTSHPHWLSWSPVDELNFHLPRCFGTLVFQP